MSRRSHTDRQLQSELEALAETTQLQQRQVDRALLVQVLGLDVYQLALGFDQQGLFSKVSRGLLCQFRTVLTRLCGERGGGGVQSSLGARTAADRVVFGAGECRLAACFSHRRYRRLRMHRVKANMAPAQRALLRK